MDYVRLVLAAILGYLLGSLNTSIIVGKFYGIDVRNHGSGNAGATNTLRTLGKKAAIFVSLGDVLKGIIACILGLLIARNTAHMAENIGLMAGGAAAIIGHNWPLYFGFKGGKGIFTTFAVVLMMDWKMGIILLGIFIVVVSISKFISLGSIIGSGMFPIVALVFKKPLEFVVFAALIGVLAIIRHSANIKRILGGTESKFSLRKKNAT